MKALQPRRLGAMPVTVVWTLCCALSLIVLCGCGPVRFVAEYDQQIDHGVSEFQEALEAHLLTIERDIGTKANRYKNHKDFYIHQRAALSALVARAELLPKNEITVAQLGLLRDNVSLMEEMHRQGITTNDLPVLRSSFATPIRAILKFELAKKRGEETE